MENYTEPTPIQRRELSMLSRPSKALLRNKLAEARTNLRVIDEIISYFDEPDTKCHPRAHDSHCGTVGGE